MPERDKFVGSGSRSIVALVESTVSRKWLQMNEKELEMVEMLEILLISKESVNYILNFLNYLTCRFNGTDFIIIVK